MKPYLCWILQQRNGYLDTLPYVWHHGSVTKTTLYVDDNEFKSLKLLASKMPGKSVSQLIREGIKLILKTKPKKEKAKNSFLKKLLSEKPRKSSSFGPDPVAYQRKLRDEWDY